MYTADSIGKMIEVLIGNIFCEFGGCLFHQVIGISMRMIFRKYDQKWPQETCQVIYRYIDDLIIFNNEKLLDYLKKDIIHPS